MSITLVTMLDRLGMTHKPRFTVEETADILGLRRDQVMDLLKRGKLLGVKSSAARWSGVFADDLSTFIVSINAPRNSRGKSEQLLPKMDPVVDESSSELQAHRDEKVEPQIDSPMTGCLDSVPRERAAAAEFIQSLSSLPKFGEESRRISLLNLTDFYVRQTQQEDPFCAPVFWDLLSDAMKKGCIPLREEWDSEAGSTFFVGVDQTMLNEMIVT